MDWSGKKVLVTGGGGFIGSHLVEELKGLGAAVRVADSYTTDNKCGNLEHFDCRGVDIQKGDLTLFATVLDLVKGMDVVFHLASSVSIPYSYLRPTEVILNNVTMALNVFEAARKSGAVVVHTSTSEVYGTARYVPIDEKHPPQPQSPYAASKLAADMIAESYFKSFDAKIVTVRPFNTYGPRQSMRAVIPNIAVQALGSGEIRLGDLRPTRDFVFVKDTVDGFIRAAESGHYGEVINLATGKEISIGDLAGKIVGICGKGKVVDDGARHRPPKSEVMRLLGDGSKAKRLLGWEPKHSLDEGLAETVRWVRRNMASYNTGVYNI